MRFVVVATVILIAALIGFFLLSRQIRSGLERPYPVNIRLQLRALAAGQAAHFREHRAYSLEITRVWIPPADNTAQGVQLRIIAADSDGYIAEGRSAGWDGRCLLAVGTAAGDSLPPGEPVCYSD